MVELTEEVVNTMAKITQTLKETKFQINRIEVSESGSGKPMIEFDIRMVEE